MPYVFVDRILESAPGERAVGIKALSLGEEFFQDHFPGMPVLPGAMILEGLVQTARHCLAQVEGGHDEWILDAVEHVKFNRFATPGMQVRLEVERDREEDGAVWFKGRALLEGETICQAKLAVRPRERA